MPSGLLPQHARDFLALKELLAYSTSTISNNILFLRTAYSEVVLYPSTGVSSTLLPIAWLE